MKKFGGKSQRGFTIIEVTLVLAIGGLIFLMVFLALPALQRSERDTERRDDMAMFLRRVKDYQTANRGALPADDPGKVVNWETGEESARNWKKFYDEYLGEDFSDPLTGKKYNLKVLECPTGDPLNGGMCSGVRPGDNEIVVVTQSTCEYVDSQGMSVPVTSTNPRRVSIVYHLEIGQDYCANS